MTERFSTEAVQRAITQHGLQRGAFLPAYFAFAKDTLSLDPTRLESVVEAAVWNLLY